MRSDSFSPKIFADTAFSHASTSERIVSVQVGELGLDLGCIGGAVSYWLPPGWSGLWAYRSGVLSCKGGERSSEAPAVNLVKLQVFMDRAADAVETGGGADFVTLAVPAEDLACAQALERWYVTQCMTGSVACRQFSSWLRQSERYQVVSFLLREESLSSKLCELAGRYGVSISHFRRLCHQALGCTAKTELREWRTARALLAKSRKETLTDLALTFGFSSPSHFSKEIRELLGVSPSSLNDITRLSSR
ncbi:helix-turn-helix domain-containing protein [Pseudomonas sp. NPDC090202]|uniref:helix-turn-helix domain-containing protein n=1 Tax=unclassified Pseudomonas TaxID=196821 RepID=UPI003825879B